MKGSIMDNESTAVRSLPLIEFEINMIKRKSGKFLLIGAIEIGRRLKEAQALVPQWEWGMWLKEALDYSRENADRMMQLFEEYGEKEPDSSTGDSEPYPSPMYYLTYPQASILLELPREERNEFIVKHNVISMTPYELQQAVKYKSQATRMKEEFLQKLLNPEYFEYLIDLLEGDSESFEAHDPIVKAAKANYIILRDKLLSEFDEVLSFLTVLVYHEPGNMEEHRTTAVELCQKIVKMLQIWLKVVD